MARRYWMQTLGCPKNQVDSDKLEGRLSAGGLAPATELAEADVVVVNTCAFVEEARQESIDTILALADARRPGARLVVTGCLAERYGDELAEALPEVDTVAGFGVPFEGITVPVPVPAGAPDVPQVPPAGGEPVGVPVHLETRRRAPRRVSRFDLLGLPRPAPRAPWAYVKVAEGCDRACGFCAIPTFRGPQRSRPMAEVVEEIAGLGVREVVLVAQDLGAYGRDQGRGERQLVPLLAEASRHVDRVRCLYLYPSELSDALVDAICATGVPYFDLSLQHVARPLLARMRRPGDGARFAARIAAIRAREPAAAFRSNFIVGYPGETEAHHDELLDFLEVAQLDWCGFFAYSAETGTHAADLDGVVPPGLVAERLAELRARQDTITAARRDDLIGARVEVLVDAVGVGRTHREAPEIDGVVLVHDGLEVGGLHWVEVAGALGPDLVALGVGERALLAHGEPAG